METKITGIIRLGDTEEIKEWVDKQIRFISEYSDDLVEIKAEIKSLKESIDMMHK